MKKHIIRQQEYKEAKKIAKENKLMRKIILIFLLLLCAGCEWGNNSEANEIDYSFFASMDSYLYNLDNSMCVKLFHVKTDINYFNVIVYDDDLNEIATIENRYRMRDTLLIIWDDNLPARLWIYNGDTGTSYWEYSENTWIEFEFHKNKDQSIPQKLYEAKKNYFDIVS